MIYLDILSNMPNTRLHSTEETTVPPDVGKLPTKNYKMQVISSGSSPVSKDTRHGVA